MKVTELEYLKEYRHKGMPAEKLAYLGQKGKKFWFVSVFGKDSKVCSGRFCMSESQIEQLSMVV